MGARSGIAGLVFLAVALFAAPGGAGAATIVNGDFESGTLAGWQVHRVTTAGDWFAYQGTDAPIGRKRKPVPADPVQAPPQGAHAAISDQANPDTLILYQDVALEPGRRHQLSLFAYYDSYKPIAVPTPNTLSVDDASLDGQKNQQYRIDVMRPDAPLESVDPADILRTVFATRPGDPQTLAPTRLTAGLGDFAGQTVRLRIATAVHEEVFNAGVDDVSISTTAAAGRSSPGGSGFRPTLFSFGKVRANRHNGVATLRLQVSGPGLVRAKGSVSSPGDAHSSGRGRLGKPIEPITIPVAASRTVVVHLRPTPSARAVLRREHRLRLRVAVTFWPLDGGSETATLPIALRLVD
jgi:hypothetical protein